MKNFISSFPYGILVHQSDGQIKDANLPALEILEISLNEIKGKTWFELPFKFINIDKTPLSEEEYPVSRVIKTGINFSDEMVIIHFSEKNLSKFINISVFRDYSEDSGSLDSGSIYLTFVDVTDKVVANNSLLSIIDNAKLGIWEWNIKTGVTKFNQQWASIVGYTLEELAPISIDTWLKLTHPSDLAISNLELTAHFEGKNPQYYCEVRMKHKDGSWIWIADTGKVIQWTDEGEPLIMSGIHQDIHQRKTTEEKLKESENKYKILVENQKDLIVKVDLQGQFLYVSPSYCEMFGKSEGELLNKKFMPLVHADDIEKTEFAMGQLLNPPHTCYIEQRAYTVEGWRWLSWLDTAVLNDDNEVIEIIGLGRDITKRKEAELELQKKLKFEKLLSEISAEFIHTKDIDSSLIDVFARLASLNQASRVYLFMLNWCGNVMSNTLEWCDTGVTAEKDNLQDLPIDIFPWWMEKLKNNEVINIENVSDLPEEAITERITLESQNIQSVLVLPLFIENSLKGFVGFDNVISAGAWTNQDEELLRILADILSNAILRKQNEDELIQAMFKAEESDRLKSTFLATMNHELRTPLNHIIGFSDMIPDMTEDENIKEFSQLIHKSGLNLLSIVEDIFDLAMIEQTNIIIRQDKVFIRDIYREAKKQLREFAAESNKTHLIRLNYKFECKIASRKIVIDKSKILHVLINLIKNAVKFTHHGEISFELFLDNDKFLNCTIEDTGIGIPLEKQETIFQFFRQADESDTREYGGVGVGLAISQRIAHAMGGSIEVESEPGIGSKFTAIFPIEFFDENDGENSQNEIESDLNLTGKTILIVEDDLVTMEMMETLLQFTNCNILKAYNGKEAVDLVVTSPEVNLILMDLKMPIMTGFDATRHIRSQYPNLPILALTAYSLQNDKMLAIEAGCNDIILKPVNKEILSSKLKYYLLD